MLKTNVRNSARAGSQSEQGTRLQVAPKNASLLGKIYKLIQKMCHAWCAPKRLGLMNFMLTIRKPCRDGHMHYSFNFQVRNSRLKSSDRGSRQFLSGTFNHHTVTVPEHSVGNFVTWTAYAIRETKNICKSHTYLF